MLSLILLPHPVVNLLNKFLLSPDLQVVYSQSGVVTFSREVDVRIVAGPKERIEVCGLQENKP